MGPVLKCLSIPQVGGICGCGGTAGNLHGMFVVAAGATMATASLTADDSKSIANTAALLNSIEYLTSMSFLIYSMHIGHHIHIKIRTFIENNITFSVINNLYEFTLF